MNNQITKAAISINNDETSKLLMQSELVIQLLEYCSIRPGAKITIAVEHAEGQKAVAELYDTAALVQSLSEALEYFQSQL